MTAPVEVQCTEERLLELYRLRDVVRQQHDARRRALQTIGGRRAGREALRAECDERRRLLRVIEGEICDAERLLARFYMAARGARCSLAELLDLVAPDYTHDPERALV